MKRRSGWSMVGVLALAGLAGCSSAPLGRSVEQTVRVEVPGCPPMRCELRNDLGLWVVESTPGSASVRTSARPLEVDCRLHGLPSGTARRAPSQEAPGEGSAAAGAAAGAGVGAAVAAPAFALGGPFGFLAATVVVIGAVSGAGLAQAADASSRAFAYPPAVQVAMACAGPAPEAAALAAAPWGLAVRAAVADDGAPPGAVWVAAVDPGGRAAAAGLRAGDLLLAIDGRSIGGTLDLDEALQRARRDATPVALTLRRAGARVDLVLGREDRP